jgi:hypothetical protein
MSSELVRQRQAHRDRVAMSNELSIKFVTPVLIPGYCPKCHLWNYLDRKSKDGKDICRKCKGKENESDPTTDK